MFATSFGEGGRSLRENVLLTETNSSLIQLTENERALGRLWRGGGGGSGGRGRRLRCLGDAVESGSSGGGVGDGRRRRTATKPSDEVRVLRVLR